MRLPEAPAEDYASYINAPIFGIRLFKRPSDGSSVLGLLVHHEVDSDDSDDDDISHPDPEHEVLLVIEEPPGRAAEIVTVATGTPERAGKRKKPKDPGGKSHENIVALLCIDPAALSVGSRWIWTIVWAVRPVPSFRKFLLTQANSHVI